jgi:hypothetical protein
MADWDFADDEIFFLFAAGVGTVVAAVRWYRPLAGRRVVGDAAGVRGMLAVTPVLCTVGLFEVLRRWSDPVYVAGHADYMLMFLLGGGVWLAAAWAAVSLVGVSPRDDALERKNVAAAVFVSCMLAGVMAAYAGANVGGGPTIWTTLVPAIAGTAILVACLVVLCVAAPVSDAIAIDRDVAAAVRNGGALVAMGIIIGRAAAGDWISWWNTFGDLLGLSWPAGVVFVVGMGLNRTMLPTPAVPVPSRWRCGVVPAAAFVIAAVAYVLLLGRPDIGTHFISYEQYMRSG